MAATIKPIDGRSIHLIQSGQVIVDLCSVVKELIENSIDSGAKTIDVRFKNQGLDIIEVQDNGSGIAPVNHASIALKHHTSKLSTYSDISSLQTFGFRGEALASLCALSNLSITTCIGPDVPKGAKLSFEASGKLASTMITAAQKGTTVSIERLFHNLPVRRRELERNIKREWHKVIALLNQYACIQTNLKFSVSQQPTKGKRILLFSTKGNPTTRENIINIFGSKAMSALVSLDLLLEMHPSTVSKSQNTPKRDNSTKQVRIVGHVSRPVHGDGRQTPDRQMFFVNGRPCGLSQFAKTFNEVYKSYNYSQSPFIFADIQLDTNMYDVNISPDKRSILLHDQSGLLDSLRSSLLALFDAHEYRIPTTQITIPHLSGRQKPPVDAKTSPPPAPSSFPVHGGHLSIPTELEFDKESALGSSDIEEKPASKSITQPGTTFSRKINTFEPSQASVSKWVTFDAGQAGLPSSDDQAICKERELFKFNDERALPKEIVQHADNPSITTGNSSTVTRVARRGSKYSKLVYEDEMSEQSSESPDSESDSETLDCHPSSCSKAICSPVPPGESHHSSSDIERFQEKHIQKKSYSNSRGIDNLSEEGSSPNVEPGPDLAKFKTHHKNFAKPNMINRYGVDSEASKTKTGGRLQCISLLDSPDSPNSHPGDNSGKAAQESLTNIRANALDDGLRRKVTTAQILQVICTTENNVACLSGHWKQFAAQFLVDTSNNEVKGIDTPDAESKLSLIIAKDDFAKMRVVGQFNLGFIIAIRPRSGAVTFREAAEHDELLIIDQHASDEKFNFETLQADTVVQSQRLVHPKPLKLSALEEEIVIENLTVLEANGFKVQVDCAGEASVGARCELLALPMSRETTFSLKDLEELIALIADGPAGLDHIPRPSSVRKMFAMRACRSSIMIGKALTPSQMYKVLRHMGELDKPWNCPHGRPTMRHLYRIQAWDEARWTGDLPRSSTSTSWLTYINK
ncbi:ATP-binding mismatch repair protein [Conoideocrella luteorostrata]|uniref:DNA mismatch repair protein PMS1 n=1 Tax=Conoideocrella luteorostrata TaxID=1105319 RepID=A0AAJ0CXN7_9HYPO|nr:ATP-binding mismatch repair protein [Conoideocrella luteorostrata]